MNASSSPSSTPPKCNPIVHQLIGVKSSVKKPSLYYYIDAFNATDDLASLLLFYNSPINTNYFSPHGSNRNEIYFGSSLIESFYISKIAYYGYPPFFILLPIND